MPTFARLALLIALFAAVGCDGTTGPSIRRSPGSVPSSK